MPESFSSDLFSPETNTEIRRLYKRKNLTSNDVAQVLKSDINYVGEGGRMVVSGIEGNPDKLIAVSYKEMSPEEAKAIYYNQRILKLLFPDNFPTIYAAFGRKSEKGISVNFRETMYGRKFTKEEILNMLSDVERMFPEQRESEIEHFSNVIRTFKELGIPFYFDKNERNYMKTEEGREVYVDTINSKFWTEEMRDRLVEFMKLGKYSERDVDLARKYGSVTRMESEGQTCYIMLAGLGMSMSCPTDPKPHAETAGVVFRDLGKPDQLNGGVVQMRDGEQVCYLIWGGAQIDISCP